MSVITKNSAGLTTVSTALIGSGKDRASIAFRIRFKSPVTLVNNIYFVRTRVFSVGPNTFSPPAGLMPCNPTWVAGDGNPFSTQSFTMDVVNHIAMTYDKDDPSKQAIYVNGVKTLLNTPKTQSLATGSQALTIAQSTGATGNACTNETEGLFLLNDYAFTQDDVYALLDGDDPATIGMGATQRWYYPLTGTPGAVPVNGDFGLTDAIGGSLPLTTYVGTVPSDSSLLYGEAMPFVSQTGYDTPVVCASGTSVRVGVKLASTGAPLLVPSAGVATPPTIRIDGGDPITLERLYGPGDHYGFIGYLPSGQKAPKDASVTMSAVDGWFSTAAGVAPGMTDAPIVSRSGKPIYGDEPATVRLGTNHSFGMTYWGGDRAVKNLALSIPAVPPTATFRADGTVSNGLDLSFFETNQENALDRTGSPKLLGLWALQFDDNDPTNATDIIIHSGDSRSGTVDEVTAYRNNGVGGIGKARVFNVKINTWNFVLQGGCTDTATTLTLDTTTGLNGTASVPTQQWIKIDDEYMKVTAVNAGTKVVTVVRGEFGSTPAAHAGSAPVLASCYNYYFALWVRIQGAGGVSNYKNLAIFAPGDWDVPETPGPITLDRSPASMKGIGKVTLDSLANGSGVIRMMDSTMGGADIASEPEHMRRDTDLFPSRDTKANPTIRVASSRAVNPTNCPFFYSPVAEMNGDKYAVTLGADITTAPAAGTKETITITGARAAGVFFGQRLEMPSGEICRVLGATGDQVDVVRGSESTTPATQAAGAILARYRLPNTSPAQYEQNGAAYVEVTTESDHGLWPGVWNHTQTSANLSLLARINVTLTAAVTTAGAVGSTTVFSVSVDPGDALYLAPGLEILFDSEIVSVTAVSVSAGVGTITVARGGRATTPATHASGVVGTGRSGGVFCQSNDGTKYGWSGNIGFSGTYQVTGPNKLVYSFAGGGVVGSQPWQQVGEQAWDTTPLAGGADVCSFPTPVSAYPYEHLGRMGAAAPGAHIWLNIPLCATNDLVDEIARSLLSTLPAGQHEVLVELANEVWNTVVPYPTVLRVASMLAGYSGSNDYFVARTGAVADRVRARFAEVGRGSEVKTVIAWQLGGVGALLTRAQVMGVPVDVCSSAPYFRPSGSAAALAAWNGSTDEQCNDTWLFNLEYSAVTSEVGPSLARDGASRRAYEAATGRTLEFICYEGGLDHCTPTPDSAITNGAARNIDQMYNPVRYFVEYDYPYVLKRVGGVDGIALFNRCQAPAAQGSPVRYALWGVTGWYGQPAGRGDGSDGKVDNRLCLAAPGQANSKHPTVNVDATNVSVRLQAVLDYNLAYSGGIVPPHDNEDMPRRVSTRIARGMKRALQAITARTPLVSTIVPPPPGPSPIPEVKRKAMPRMFRM